MPVDVRDANGSIVSVPTIEEVLAVFRGVQPIADSLSVVLASDHGKLPSNAVYSNSGTITRPNDAAEYAVGDVVGGLLTLPDWLVGEVLINTINFYRGSSAIQSGEGSYTLHLYSGSPGTPLADNAVWDLPSGDRAIYQGPIDLGPVIDVGSTVRLDVHGVGAQVRATGTTMYGYLVTEAIYVPAAQSTMVLQIHGERL